MANVTANTDVQPSSGNSYSIMKGDTLTSIAKQYNTTVDELVKINNIKDKDRVNEGQIISIK